VSTINLVFEMNFAIFAVFAALLLTEVMGALLLLLFWEKGNKPVLEYVIPIWEVTGTFGAFWVVAAYFAFPALLIPVAGIFGPLLIIFLILFVGRNSSIVFGEFITRRKWLNHENLYRVYAITTVLLGVALLIFLSSLIGGKGIDLAADTFSVSSWITSGGNILFLIGTILLCAGLGPVLFSLEQMRKIALPLTALGIAVSITAYYLYSPSLLSAWILVPIVLTIAAPILFFSGRLSKVVENKAIFITLFSIVIFSLQFLIYPKILGQTVQVDSVTTTGPLASAYFAMTTAGAVLLAVMLFFYMMITSRKRAEGVPISTQQK
jgi:cytochrome bd ubiquinol oxidase subunit II